MASTRTLAVGQRLHHLKVFFSNRFVYAQVTRKTDGHVSSEAPFRGRAPPHPTSAFLCLAFQLTLDVPLTLPNSNLP